MNLFSKFHDTIFVKTDTNLQKAYEVLSDLVLQYPENKELKKEYENIKKGYFGEEEIAYQLSKSNIGMYVLRDFNIKCEDQNAQIDFIVITPACRYLIECKNYYGDITVNEKGDFIKSYTYNGNTVREGIESPLRQVEAQREVMKKRYYNNATTFELMLDKITKFDYDELIKTMVVLTNKKSILDTSKAPDNIKYKVIKSDNLIRQIQYDIDHLNKDDVLLSKKTMEKIANAYLEANNNKEIDYYANYKQQFDLKEPKSFQNNLKARLISLRKRIATEKKIPAYYVFTNEEMEKLIEIHPKSKEELKDILPEIKCHGDAIINEINKHITDIEII